MNVWDLFDRFGGMMTAFGSSRSDCNEVGTWVDEHLQQLQRLVFWADR